MIQFYPPMRPNDWSYSDLIEIGKCCWENDFIFDFYTKDEVSINLDAE